MSQAIISASILSANFAHLSKDIKAALDAGVDQIHFDVMDNHYVPNLTVGALVCKSLREAGFTVPIDVHLMVDDPESFIQPFAEAGASLLCFHPETVTDVNATFDKIRQAGMQAGLAFNPDNHLEVSHDILKQCDLILIMSVNPGFAGQKFIPHVLDKIKYTRNKLTQFDLNTPIGVDGGVKASNIHKIVEAGADFFVIGSGLFHADDYKTRMAEIRKAIAGVK